jgi:hypothetical protein
MPMRENKYTLVDLKFEMDSGRISRLPTLLPKPVFIGSVDNKYALRGKLFTFCSLNLLYEN